MGISSSNLFRTKNSNVIVNSKFIENNKLLLTSAREEYKDTIYHHMFDKIFFFGLDMNDTDFFGNTALHDAASYGYTHTVKALLLLGAEIDPINNDGDTPLHIAARRGNELTTRLLLEKSANVDSLNNKLETPLHDAAYNAHAEVIKILCEYDADIHIKNEWEKTAYYYVLKKCSEDKIVLAITKPNWTYKPESLSTRDQP